MIDAISMSASRANHLLRQCLSHPLPTLTQGSTLQILSSLPNTNLSIRSKWRDSGKLTMVQQVAQNESEEAELSIVKQEDKLTSMGRDESHILIQLRPKQLQSSVISSRHNMQPLPTAQFKRSNDPPPSSPSLPDSKKVILDDGTILPDSEEWSHPPAGFKRIEYSDDVAHITNDKKDDNKTDNFDKDNQDLFMEVTVPEKVNLDCDLTQGGSVVIQDKIEGDIRIQTTDGNISVKKLRGHVINIQALGIGNSICSSDLLEAESLLIDLPNGNSRLRAKRIHANTCAVTIGGQKHEAKTPVMASTKFFDDDDSGAVCDISSLYVTGEAMISVNAQNNGHENNKQAVRVKSNHGHVTVEAFGSQPSNERSTGSMPPPLVDMGGVNGSCEVFLSGHDDEEDDYSTDPSSSWISGHVHFDSISADSVSVIQADIGNLNVTIDRKVESDLKMVSALNADKASNMLDVDTLVDESISAVNDMLTQMDQSAGGKQKDQMIQVRTKAFTSKDDTEESSLNLKNCEYVNGWIENKSEEPDSRFDRKIRGGSSGGSVGKIRLEGAHDQALQSFRGKEQNSDNFQRPLLVVTSTGEIILETLSWLGNIARRYGFDDSRKDEEKLGRTATRRGRSLVEPSQD